MGPSLAAFIEQSSWSRGLTPSELGRLTRVCRECTVAVAEPVFLAGADAEYWVGTIDGLIAQSVEQSDGSVTVLTLAGAGHWFGEGTLIKRERWRYSAIARRQSRVALLPRSVFEWLLETNLHFNRFLVHSLNDRASRYVTMLASDRLMSVEERVMRALLQAAEIDHHTAVHVVEMSQADIALLAGLSRQRINGALRKLQDQGQVRLKRGCIEITSLKRPAGR